MSDNAINELYDKLVLDRTSSTSPSSPSEYDAPTAQEFNTIIRDWLDKHDCSC